MTCSRCDRPVVSYSPNGVPRTSRMRSPSRMPYAIVAPAAEKLIHLIEQSQRTYSPHSAIRLDRLLAESQNSLLLTTHLDSGLGLRPFGGANAHFSPEDRKSVV